MKPVSRASKKKNHKVQPEHSYQEVTDLKKLMSGIKDLQNRVSHMPIYLQLTKTNRPNISTPKIKQKCSSSKSKYTQNISSKREQRDHSVKTIRKSNFYPNYESTQFNNDSKTFNLHLNKRQPLTGPLKDYSCFQSTREPDFMNNYVSLQLENLKLEKYNIELQKRLVQQSLMMERREKQLLKNKLKRIKTHQTHEHSQKSKQDNHKQAQTPVVSSFDISPIKIKIPQLPAHKEETNHSLKLRAPQPKQVFLDDVKNEQSIDSLLLSDENERSARADLEKCGESTLEKEFWLLLGDVHKKGKGEGRQALGDIANKLKVARNK